MSAQTEMLFSPDTLAPTPGPLMVVGSGSSGSAAWVERWHNSDLRHCDVPREHQVAALSERGKWLFTGPRWPINPTPAMQAHCEARWLGVAKWMRVHGWWCEWGARAMRAFENFEAALAILHPSADKAESNEDDSTNDDFRDFAHDEGDK